MSDETEVEETEEEASEDAGQQEAAQVEAVESDAQGAATAPTATAVLEYVVSALVQDEEAVQVDVDDSKRTLQLEVRVGPDDMGRVIGRRGRVANAIRTLTRAAAARDGVEVDIEFLD